MSKYVKFHSNLIISFFRQIEDDVDTPYEHYRTIGSRGASLRASTRGEFQSSILQRSIRSRNSMRVSQRFQTMETFSKNCQFVILKSSEQQENYQFCSNINEQTPQNSKYYVKPSINQVPLDGQQTITYQYVRVYKLQ